MIPKLLQSTQSENVRTALFVSLLLFLLTSVFLLSYGKTGSLLLINQHYNPVLDVLFRYGTYLGDTLIYLPLLVYCLFFNRSFIIPLVLSLLIGLLLTHFLKRIVFPHQLRPISLEAQGIVLHKIKGVHMNRVHSFPSGHTATAFGAAVLLATVVRKRIWAVLLPLVAFFVGYSRVYLAQHYVNDVLGGIVIGMITALLSLWLYTRMENRLPPFLQINKTGPKAS